MDKYITENVYCVDYSENNSHKCLYFIADSFEDALEMFKDRRKYLSGYTITQVTKLNYTVLRKSTKTITVNV